MMHEERWHSCGYVLITAVVRLPLHARSERSPVGIAISIGAVIVMPWLAWRKRVIARRIGSDALRGDAASSRIVLVIDETDMLTRLRDGRFGTTLVGMEQRDADRRTERRSSWRPVAMALMLMLLVHHVVIAMPLRATTPVLASASQQTNVATPCDSGCPSGIITLCVPGRVCAAVEATLTRLSFTPLTLLVLLILTLLALPTSCVALRHPRWLWPPDRRRALLQVFLI